MNNPVSGANLVSGRGILTVDGSEILQLSLVVEIPVFTVFYTSKRWLALGFLPSTVVLSSMKIINSIYTLHSGYLLGTSPFNGLLGWFQGGYSSHSAGMLCPPIVPLAALRWPPSPRRRKSCQAPWSPDPFLRKSQRFFFWGGSIR